MFERMSKRALRAAGPPAVAVALMAAAAAVPGSARAGEYHVYSCRTPSGESAPADGWSGSKTGTATLAEDTCSQPGGALIAALRDQTARTANADVATWAFTAPPDTTLAGGDALARGRRGWRRGGQRLL